LNLPVRNDDRLIKLGLSARPINHPRMYERNGWRIHAHKLAHFGRKRHLSLCVGCVEREAEEKRTEDDKR
jgi:hypothetical protein